MRLFVSIVAILLMATAAAPRLQHGARKRESILCFNILGIQIEGSLEVLRGFGPFLHVEICVTEREVSVGKLRIECDDLFERRSGLRVQTGESILRTFFVQFLRRGPGLGRNWPVGGARRRGVVAMVG